MDVSAPLLEARSLAVEIGGRRLLTDVNLSVDKGELIALAGPNGAGKSTLLGVLAGDAPPAAGELRLDGRPAAKLSARERGLLRAVLPQQHAIGFAFTVEEVVAFGRYPHRRQDDPSAVARALTAVEMADLRHRSVLELSGGELTRTALARVLAQDAHLLLLDEPTAALDLRHQRQVLDVCRRLTEEGRGVVLVLHDLSLAAESDRLGLVADGRLVLDLPERALTTERLTPIYETPVAVLEHPETGRPVVTHGAPAPQTAASDTEPAGSAVKTTSNSSNDE